MAIELNEKLEKRFAETIKESELKQDSYEAQMHAGFCYMYCNEWKLAIEKYNKAIFLNSNISGPYYNRGRCYFELKNFDCAFENLNSAIALSQKPFLEYTALGHCYTELKNFDLAISNYQKALAITPKHSPAHFGIANCLLNKSRILEAIDYYQNMVKIVQGSDLIKVYYSLGNCYLRLNDTNSAAKTYEKLKILNINEANKLLNLINSKKNNKGKLVLPKFDRTLKKKLAKEWLIITPSVIVALIIAYIVGANGGSYDPSFDELWLKYVFICLLIVEGSRSILWAIKILKSKE